jgi:hypothetical protein
MSESPVKSPRDYLRHAEECEALARTAVSEEQRQSILGMADTWRFLAKQREKHRLAKARVEAIDPGIGRRERNGRMPSGAVP